MPAVCLPCRISELSFCCPSWYSSGPTRSITSRSSGRITTSSLRPQRAFPGCRPPDPGTQPRLDGGRARNESPCQSRPHCPCGDSRSSASAWGAASPPDRSVAHFRRGCGGSAHGRCGDELAPHPILADSYRSSDEQQEQERRRQTRSQRQDRHHVPTLHWMAFCHQQDSFSPSRASSHATSGGKGSSIARDSNRAVARGRMTRWT